VLPLCTSSLPTRPLTIGGGFTALFSTDTFTSVRLTRNHLSQCGSNGGSTAMTKTEATGRCFVTLALKARKVSSRMGVATSRRNSVGQTAWVCRQGTEVGLCGSWLVSGVSAFRLTLLLVSQRMSVEGSFFKNESWKREQETCLHVLGAATSWQLTRLLSVGWVTFSVGGSATSLRPTSTSFGAFFVKCCNLFNDGNGLGGNTTLCLRLCGPTQSGTTKSPLLRRFESPRSRRKICLKDCAGKLESGGTRVQNLWSAVYVVG
jgi:hypothetical protein